MFIININQIVTIIIFLGCLIIAVAVACIIQKEKEEEEGGGGEESSIYKILCSFEAWIAGILGALGLGSLLKSLPNIASKVRDMMGRNNNKKNRYSGTSGGRNKTDKEKRERERERKERDRERDARKAKRNISSNSRRLSLFRGFGRRKR